LQEKLTKIADDIGVFGMYSASLIVLVLIIRFAIEAIIANSFSGSDLSKILKFFIIGITVIVVAIPEGLPLAVTLSLAFSVKKMLKDQNLVRKLQACETMGGANTICSDKTGTLTQNVMTLKSFWNNELINIDTYSEKININDFVPNAIFDEFMQCTACNCSAFLEPVESGSKTEIAMLLFLKRCGIDFEDYKKQIEVVQKMPFSSSRKRMSMLLNVNGKNRLVVKGASEMVLSCCSKFHKTSGEIVSLDNGLMSNVEKAIEDMAKQALRTIVIAYKDCNGEDT
jgi:Ca2+ transporting ATPase